MSFTSFDAAVDLAFFFTTSALFFLRTNTDSEALFFPSALFSCSDSSPDSFPESSSQDFSSSSELVGAPCTYTRFFFSLSRMSFTLSLVISARFLSSSWYLANSVAMFAFSASRFSFSRLSASFLIVTRSSRRIFCFATFSASSARFFCSRSCSLKSVMTTSMVSFMARFNFFLILSSISARSFLNGSS